MEIMSSKQGFVNLCVAEDVEGFVNLCVAEDVGLENYIECSEANPHKCSYSTPYGPYGAIIYCGYPLRIYICKNLEK